MPLNDLIVRLLGHLEANLKANLIYLDSSKAIGFPLVTNFWHAGKKIILLWVHAINNEIWTFKVLVKKINIGYGIRNKALKMVKIRNNCPKLKINVYIFTNSIIISTYTPLTSLTV